MSTFIITMLFERCYDSTVARLIAGKYIIRLACSGTPPRSPPPFPAASRYRSRRRQARAESRAELPFHTVDAYFQYRRSWLDIGELACRYRRIEATRGRYAAAR